MKNNRYRRMKKTILSLISLSHVIIEKGLKLSDLEKKLQQFWQKKIEKKTENIAQRNRTDKQIVFIVNASEKKNCWNNIHFSWTFHRYVCCGIFNFDACVLHSNAYCKMLWVRKSSTTENAYTYCAQYLCVFRADMNGKKEEEKEKTFESDGDGKFFHLCRGYTMSLK